MNIFWGRNLIGHEFVEPVPALWERHVERSWFGKNKKNNGTYAKAMSFEPQDCQEVVAVRCLNKTLNPFCSRGDVSWLTAFLSLIDNHDKRRNCLCDRSSSYLDPASTSMTSSLVWLSGQAGNITGDNVIQVEAGSCVDFTRSSHVHVLLIKVLRKHTSMWID